MMKHTLAGLISLIVVASAPDIVRAESAADDHVRTFLGACVLSFPNIELISQQAEAAGFRPLPKEMMAMGMPSAHGADGKGWAIIEDGKAMLLLGISSGRIDGMEGVSCTVAGMTENLDDLIAMLRKTNTIGPLVLDEIESGQRYRTWRTARAMDDTLIQLIDASPMGMAGATLGITKMK